MRRQTLLIALGLALSLIVGAVFALAYVGFSIHIRIGGTANPTRTARVSVSAYGPVSSVPLFPGGAGDVMIRITNLNARETTITGLLLPSSDDFAPGFTTSALVDAKAGCSAANSGVIWEGATPNSGTSDALVWPVVVRARSSLVATLTDAAFMELTAPPDCEGSYFAMPSPTGVTGFVGGGVPTPSPTSDRLTPRCPPPGGPPGAPPGPPPGPPPVHAPAPGPPPEPGGCPPPPPQP